MSQFVKNGLLPILLTIGEAALGHGSLGWVPSNPGPRPTTNVLNGCGLRKVT
jgi:hypothetical protein